MRLYTYYRSSAAYRVRIALGLKGLAAEHSFVRLAREGGEQHSAAYAALNPQQLVPLLVDGDFVLNQSLAIIEYLEQRQPEPPLLPAEPHARARVRALAYAICCDIHPLQNTRVQHYLGQTLGHDEATIGRWIRHFIELGFASLETTIAADPARGGFCHGGRPTLADVCLVPQLYNARRYGCELSRFPTLVAIAETCARLPAFRDAEPERQPDATGS